MVSCFPTHSEPLFSSSPSHRGRGTLHERTDMALRLLGIPAPPQGPSETPEEVEAGSELRLPGGARAALTWTGQGHEPSDELSLQARCGLMTVHGRRAGRPRALPFDYVGTVAAAAHLTALLAAELTRRRSGSPVTVRTRADACALISISQYLAAATAGDPEAVPVNPGHATFTTADGVDFEIESLTAEPWAGFWEALGAPASAVARGWAPFQFRYATACAPLPPELARTAARTSWARVRGIARESGVGLVRLDATPASDPTEGGLWTLRPLGTGGEGHRSAPTGGLPLAGLTVLEAGRRIQAPLAAHLLRMLGAEVVRVEPPGGDPLRGMPPMCGDLSARWLALNHGKDAVEVDIKSASGRSDLLELARGADVFLHNWAPGKAEQLGLCAESMARVNPGLVYAHTSGWGDSSGDLPPGTDFMVQAHAGLTAPAPEGRGVTVASLMTVLDVLGGFLGAQVVTAALAHREGIGEGVAVESSLRGAAHLLSSARRTRGEEGESADFAGASPGARTPRPVTAHLPELEHGPWTGSLLHRTRGGALTVRSPWEVA